jgi:protein-serine/threonine kinase
MIDITPLPSPVTPSGSPGRWRRARASLDRLDSRSETAEETANRPSSSDSLNCVSMSVRKSRAFTDHGESSAEYMSIHDVNSSVRGRNRGSSGSVPDPLQAPRHHNLALAGPVPMRVEEQLSSANQHLHREEYLAVKRGLTMPMSNLPTPPRSTRDTDGSDSESTPASDKAAGQKPTYYQARSIHSGKLRRWREVRKLGEGTFSTVVLAVSEGVEGQGSLTQSTRVRQATEECHFSPKSLVAVKICEHGPAGGADEARVESSLTRELEILKAIDHPSLVHLKAVNILEHRTYMVLGYCAGGDLYDLAFNRPDLLTPSFIQRIFAELVAAVRYLHSEYIVHRDIKLESEYRFRLL